MWPNARQGEFFGWCEEIKEMMKDAKMQADEEVRLAHALKHSEIEQEPEEELKEQSGVMRRGRVLFDAGKQRRSFCWWYACAQWQVWRLRILIVSASQRHTTQFQWQNFANHCYESSLRHCRAHVNEIPLLPMTSK
jgi:hypothetical protein